MAVTSAVFVIFLTVLPCCFQKNGNVVIQKSGNGRSNPVLASHTLGAEIHGGVPTIPALISTWWSCCEYPLLYLKFVANGIDLKTISSKEFMTASSWATAVLIAKQIVPKMFKPYVADRPPPPPPTETNPQCRMVCDLEKKTYPSLTQKKFSKNSPNEDYNYSDWSMNSEDSVDMGIPAEGYQSPVRLSTVFGG